MESRGSTRFHDFKRYENIVWNHMDPCMGCHTALDPDNDSTRFYAWKPH